MIIETPKRKAKHSVTLVHTEQFFKVTISELYADDVENALFEARKVLQDPDSLWLCVSVERTDD